MNLVDFLFENTAVLEKNLILGTKESKSYKAIFEESSKLASYLKNKFGEDKKILLVAPNSQFFVVAYLGILKSGNICVPLNYEIEENVLEFITKKTDSCLGFFTEVVCNRLRPKSICITEKSLDKIINEATTMPLSEAEFDGERVSEIIFTSGSTALPKGVVLSHNNIIANTSSIAEYLELSEKEIMMVILPFFYCYGLSLLHTHIRAGGSLVLNNNFMFLGSTLNDLNKYHCTGLAGVPSHFQILLRKSDMLKKTKFPSLRYVTQAGGKLHNSFITEFTEAFPEIQFYVMYGQTEATARLSYLPPKMLKEKIGSIGCGIPGVEIKIVNNSGKCIRPNDPPGEILARGKNIMMGYYDDPDATAEVIKDGWLYTGDMATIDENGYIFITSRKKEIIKVGGKRISPKEIEEVISMLPGIIDCTIEAVDDELLGEAIKATIITNESGKMITADNLKQHCHSKLSGYKVPTYIVFKESMELSLSGKKIIKGI
jgi:long-chain acyl-CoA synthetase